MSHLSVCCDRERLPSRDKAIAQILLEAPALPSPGVGQFLAEVAGQGGDWATLALSCARDIIMHRPPNRSSLSSASASCAACVGALCHRLAYACKPEQPLQTELACTCLEGKAAER